MGYDFLLNGEDGSQRLNEKPPIWGAGGLGYYDDPERNRVFGVYSSMIKFRSEFKNIIDEGTFVLTQDGPIRRVNIEHPDMDIVVVTNFGLEEQTLQPLWPRAGEWYNYFFNDTLVVDDPAEELTLQPGEFHLFTSIALESPGDDLVNDVRVEEEDEVTAIEDEIIASLMVYPNPVKDQLTIELTPELLKSEVHVEVLNYLGAIYAAEVFELQDFGIEPTIRMSASQMTPGIYFVKVSGEGWSKTIRLVKSD
jgi:hypothetical protein